MASKKRLAYKRKKFTSMKEQTKDAFYRETLKHVQDANARLESLSRKYGSRTWASKKLFNRLDVSTLKAIKRGRVNITKNMTMTQLTSVRNAVDMFLKSKTSTKAGIKQVKESTLKSMKATLSLDMEIDDADIEDFYDMLTEDVFKFFADKIGASTLWALIEDARESNSSQESFISMLERYIEIGNDLDIRDKAIRLYEKYVL